MEFLQKLRLLRASFPGLQLLPEELLIFIFSVASMLAWSTHSYLEEGDFLFFFLSLLGWEGRWGLWFRFHLTTV